MCVCVSGGGGGGWRDYIILLQKLNELEEIFFPNLQFDPPPPAAPPPSVQLGTREYLVLNIIVRMIFIWSEFLLLVFLDISNFCQSKFW